MSTIMLTLTESGEPTFLVGSERTAASGQPHWYPFAPPTGSAMYCLPQVGTKASLYYPDATGSGALIVGTVRKNGGESAKTSDTNTRYFGTEHGSELKLAPSHVNLQKDPEGAMLVSLNDETGIEITSPGKLTMTAELELELYTPQQIILGSESQILAYRGESEAGLVVESEYHLLGEKVWADGSDRTTYPPFDDEPELGEEPEPDPPFNWGKLVKNVLVGLAVVVAVAAVAALTVATLGAGPILIGAVASGALIGGSMGVGMMAVSDIARGEVSDMSDYALTGLKDSFIGAVSGAIFGPGAAVGTAFARKMGAAGAEGAFTSIMDQVLRGEKINWSTVAKDAGIGMLTLGVLDSKVGQKFTGFVGKVGNKVTPDWVKKGVTKANEGFEKVVDKLSDAGSKMGQKLKGYLKVPSNRKKSRLEELRAKYGKLSSKELHQRINLRGAVGDEYKRLKSIGVTNDEMGPCLAGVLDKKTGKIYFARNTMDGSIPNELAKVIKKRLVKMPKNILNGYKKSKGAGSHAEILALNEALLSREGSKLSDFMIYVVKSNGSQKLRGTPVPRCPHCEYLTQGTNFIPEVLKYGKNRR